MLQQLLILGRAALIAKVAILGGVAIYRKVAIFGKGAMAGWVAIVGRVAMAGEGVAVVGSESRGRLQRLVKSRRATCIRKVLPYEEANREDGCAEAREIEARHWCSNPWMEDRCRQV